MLIVDETPDNLIVDMLNRFKVMRSQLTVVLENLRFFPHDIVGVGEKKILKVGFQTVVLEN